MKKILLFVAVVLFSTQLFSKVWTVRASGGDYTSLNTAITNTNAAIVSGDTIDVLGTFNTGKITFSATTTPKTLVIQGHGVDSTFVQYAASKPGAAVGSSAIFYIDGNFINANYTIKNMTIQNMNGSSSGGGIRVNNTGTSNATINLAGLRITNNTASNGAGVYVQGRVIANIDNCNITGNTATAATNGGGGIAFVPTTANIPISATIKNSSISNNTSSGFGGAGISVFSRGTASFPSNLWIENSTIYGNSSTSSAKSGGGIYVKNVETSAPMTLTLNHCTVSGNTTNAGVGGDGVCVDNGGSTTTTLVMNNTIVMGNTNGGTSASQVGVNAASTTSSMITNGGVNNSIFTPLASSTWLTAAGTNNNNNITAVEADLAFSASLSSVSKPVLVIGSTSIAKDYVTTDYLSTALTTDQVGNTRNGVADAGAYEYQTSIGVTASAGIGGTIATNPIGTYASGASVHAVAAGSGSSVFKNWTDGGVIVSTNADYTFLASKTVALVANFTAQYNVQTATDGNGIVAGAAVVVGGNPITLTPTPNAGYAFDAWTVSAGTATIVISANPLTFTPTADCTISASFKSIIVLTPTVTYARTATTLDVLVTNPIGYTGTLTYNVLAANDAVLASAIAASSEISTLVYSATGLTANTSYAYKVVAVINGSINSATASTTATTRKANGSVQLIDDFVDNSSGWTTQSSSITIPSNNLVIDGINPSATCAKVTIASGAVNYAGLQNTKERIEVGPNAPYQYLHVKMYRDADNGTMSLTFLVRKDNSAQAQFGSAESLAVSTVSASGPWVDYVFNLKDAAYATDKTVFGFYIKPNKTVSNTTAASISYIDDVYLSNDGTPSTANLTLDLGTAINSIQTENFVSVYGKELHFNVASGSVEVFNVVGRLVASGKTLNSKISLNSAGIYFIKINTNQGTRIQKVLVK